MMLDLADGMLFRSRFARKMLTPNVLSPSGFCVDDAAPCFPSEKRCRYLDLTEEQKAGLMLNVPATTRYLRPQIPRSWHSVAHGTGWSPVVSDAAYADLSDTDEQVNLLIAEPSENAALCLFAQPGVVTVRHTMQLGDTVKIMNDRLKPQTVVDSFSLEQAVQLSSLIAILGTRLQCRIVPPSPIADFFNGLTSPSTSRIRQHPQTPAWRE